MKRTILIITAVLLSNSSVAQHEIKNSVFGSGNTPVENAHHRISGTVGQTLIGTAQDDATMTEVGFWYQVLDLETSIEQVPEFFPKEFRLDQNYPNPFNPTTTIVLAVPKPSHVILRIYDTLGREISTFRDEKMEAGEYKIVFDASSLPSGIYIYRIEAEGFIEAKRLILMK